MNGISHKQAIKWIDRRLDGLLDVRQRLSLEEHLRSCDACRTYATEMDLLPAHLQNEFHLRWDKDPGPSQKVIEHVTRNARSIPMTFRFSSGMKVIAGIAALVVLAFLVNFVVSQFQNESTRFVGTQPADSSSLPEDRLLAFTLEQDGNLDIHTMDADGSGLTNLTNDPAQDANPIWSPDGKRIAFESDRTGISQIYLMNADGSNVTQFTTGETAHHLPMNIDGITNPWSPDGNAILYLQNNLDEKTWTLVSQNIEKRNRISLATGQLYYDGISWSPDGKYIGYLLDASPNLSVLEPEIHIIGANGNNTKNLKDLIPYNENLDSRYRWSPKGESVIFTANRNDPSHKALTTVVYEYDLKSDTLIQKDNLQEMVDWEEWGHLVTEFRLFEKPGLISVWQRPDGKGDTFDVDAECLELNIKKSPGGNFAIGAYCPDNQFKFYWANTDGSTIKQLLDLRTDAMVSSFSTIIWSPDDRYIAFNIVSDKSSMYILNVEDALKDASLQPIQISVSSGELYIIPSWQPVSTKDMTEEKPIPASLAIDPTSCKPFSDPDFDLQPPNELYGYELIQGTSIVDGDFSYEFWLYCDPALRPGDTGHFSAVAGLGVYGSWRYNGPNVEGSVRYYFGFEPGEPLGETGWNGPLYKASAGGTFGIDISESKAQEYIRQGTPIQFRIIVDSTLGQNGAMLSFSLEPAQTGYRVVNLQAESLAPAHRGLIAFTSVQNGNLDILSMRSNGSELTNLTDNPANDFNPFWSPDGRRIAFESDRDGSTQIFLMEADGSNVNQLTEGKVDYRFETANPWSPDGNKLIFTERFPGEADGALYIMDADGQNKIQLVRTPDTLGATSWSPDSEQIAFIRVEPQGNRDTARIYVVDADGKDLRDITKLLPTDEDLVSWNFQWAADGKSMFFVAGRYAWENNNARYAVYEASLDGGQLTETFATSDRIEDWWDGTALIQGTGMPPSLTWFRPNITASVLKPFENCQATDSFGSMYGRSSNGYLLFGAQCSNGYLWLYWANPDGTVIQQLLDSPIYAKDGSLVDISWAPDERFIAFTIAFPDKTEMYVLNVNEALQDPSIQPDKYVVGGAGFINYNLSWQP